MGSWRIWMLHVGALSAQPRAAPIWLAFERRMAELGYKHSTNFALEFVQVPPGKKDLHCSRPRHQGASYLSSSVPGVSRSERTTETPLSAQRIMFQARKTYSQWSAGLRLTRTSARTVTNSIVNKATSADAAWISPVHQT